MTVSWLRLGRSSLVVLVVALFVPAVGAATTPASAAVPSFESSLLSLTNADRARAGLAPLQSSSTLVGIARSWSDHMAATGQLGHDPSLASKVSGWSSLGENVAMAYSASQAETLFMSSAGHRANILQPSFNRVGIGVTRAASGAYWITVDFEQTAGYQPTAASRSTGTVKHSTSAHRSSSTSTRSSTVTRASRSTVRAAVPGRASAANGAVAMPSAAALATAARLAAIEARDALLRAPPALQLGAAGNTAPQGDSDPTVPIVLGGLAVTALAGVATVRPARVRVRNPFRPGAGG